VLGAGGVDRDRPVTVHVGYHKTGTSWMQRRYIPNHPGLQLVGNSIAPMDDPFLSYLIGTNDWTFDPEHAWRLFARQVEDDNRRHLVVSAERLSGHPFSGGYDQVRLAERIRATLPAARILVVVRDQVPMLESVYRQLIESGYPGSFSSLFESERWTMPAFDPTMYEYDLVLHQYRRLFGADRVLMARYELLEADPEAFVSQVCAFIGVPPAPAPRERVNRTVSAEFMVVTRWLNRFRRSERNRWPAVRLPARAIGALVAKGGRLVPASGRRLLSDEDRAWVAAHFVDSNARLAAMLGHDAAAP
jgi:hypothetical protein